MGPTERIAEKPPFTHFTDLSRGYRHTASLWRNSSGEEIHQPTAHAAPGRTLLHPAPMCGCLLRRRRQGLASGMLNTAQQVGISLGLVVIAGVSAYGADAAAVASAPEEAPAAGFRYALAAGCGLALLGSVASLLTVRGGAASGDEHRRYLAAASAVPSFCPRPARARHVPGANLRPEPGKEPSRERRE